MTNLKTLTFGYISSNSNLTVWDSVDCFIIKAMYKFKLYLFGNAPRREHLVGQSLHYINVKYRHIMTDTLIDTYEMLLLTGR